MLRRLLRLVAVIALCMGCWLLYRCMTQRSPMDSGDVTVIAPAANVPASGDMSAPATADLPAPASTAGAPTADAASPSPAPPDAAVGAPSVPPAAGGTPPVGGPAPQTTPTITAGATAVSGAGRFQWYRQGNITYRIDTQSGDTCVAFATNQEWRKQQVLDHGCDTAS